MSKDQLVGALLMRVAWCDDKAWEVVDWAIGRLLEREPEAWERIRQTLAGNDERLPEGDPRS